MDSPTSPSHDAPTAGRRERLVAGLQSAFNRYAAWLVRISWKRFFLLSLLVLVSAALLKNLPPFSWKIGQTDVPGEPASQVVSEPASQPKRASGRDFSIHIDEKGVRIVHKQGRAEPLSPRSLPDTSDPAATAPLPPDADGRAGDASADVTIQLPPEAAEEVKAAIGEARDAIESATEEAAAERRAGRTLKRSVRLGDFLVNLALLLIFSSAIIKIVVADRAVAEQKADAAEQVAEAESLKRQVVEARMAAMQAQVEPHFLFNTLASIDHLIEVDPQRASKMQKNLIALLRASMPSMRDRGTTLGRELDVVRPYLEILRVRMQDRLQTELRVSEGLYSAEFPPMMRQSLVENAIKHGIEPKAEGGLLTVHADVGDGRLTVTVADTGVGFGQAPTAGTGIGLSNLRERLKLLYGSAAELKISANTPSGTCAAVTVPYKSGVE